MEKGEIDMDLRRATNPYRYGGVVRLINVMKEFKEWLRSRNTKVANKTLKVLDKDCLSIHLSKDGYLYFEINGAIHGEDVPDYVIQQLELFAKKKGYRLWYQ